jgi:hypothetical protein
MFLLLQELLEARPLPAGAVACCTIGGFDLLRLPAHD